MKNDKVLKKELSIRQFKGVYKWGLLISILAHGLIILAFTLPPDVEMTPIKVNDTKFEIKVVNYEDLPPPPSILPEVTLPMGNGEGKFGEIPLPVPDTEAERETILDVINSGFDPINDGNTIIKITDPNDINPENVPVFIPYEERPEFIKRVEPEYPTLGREAEIEGTVGLMIYVGADGHVKNVVVTQPMDISAFNQSAVEAAYQCTFTPAKMSGSPIGVWIALPMHFVLH